VPYNTAVLATVPDRPAHRNFVIIYPSVSCGISVSCEICGRGGSVTDYGTILDTNNLWAVQFPVLKLRRGDLLSIPGSVVHGGPAYTGFRAILFFIGHPEGKDGLLYNSDLQYSAGTILIDITYDLWEHITPDDRFCLLTRLFQMAQEYNDLYKHFGDPISRFYFWVKTYGSLKPKPNDTSVTRLIKGHADVPRIDGSVSKSIPVIIPKSPKPKGKAKAKVISKSKPIVKKKTKPNVIRGKQTKTLTPATTLETHLHSH
jgi:hypothetical protein